MISKAERLERILDETMLLIAYVHVVNGREVAEKEAFLCFCSPSYLSN